MIGKDLMYNGSLRRLKRRNVVTVLSIAPQSVGLVASLLSSNRSTIGTADGWLTHVASARTCTSVPLASAPVSTEQLHPCRRCPSSPPHLDRTVDTARSRGPRTRPGPSDPSVPTPALRIPPAKLSAKLSESAPRRGACDETALRIWRRWRRRSAHLRSEFP